ncbi:phage scaffolding protein [Haloimpatiens massiliensis]|uniref:phage scaffolding protein n=1 Tax=Haloimpatiens massiliensis TaxID=1658110 RepID=UPI000C864EF6|nr:phage scaffolding protein [Haloimpatiens massiliensis]
MEWLRKLLESATIKDGKLDIDGLMKSINTEFPKNAVPKDKFNEVSEAKKQLESDIKERDNQLETLKKSTGDNAELQKQIETLQTDNKKKDEEYQAQLKDLQVSNAIKLAVADKAQDAELVAGLFDKSKLILGDDGKITGLEDQLKNLQESKAFLFKQEEKQETQPGFKIGVDGTSQNGDVNSQLASIFGNSTK